MAKKCSGSKKKCGGKKGRTDTKETSYRMKCERTANGLSHFVMYGDVKKSDSLL